MTDEVDDAADGEAETTPGPQRCPVHPARPAYDTCPVCARPRCAADASEAVGGGCQVCRGAADARPARPPVDLRALVGGAVAGHLTAVLAGAISSDYVGAPYFQYIVPGIAGLACGAAVERGAGRARGFSLRVLAVVLAMLSAGVAYRAVPGGSSDLSVLPFACAALGSWLWTAPPKAQPRGTRSKK